MNYAPVCLFVYNRPEHTKKTIDYLLKNKEQKETDLFIFSDYAKNESHLSSVRKVREIIRNINGFKNIEIIERESNLGLANSIISGVTQVVNKYGKVIVLEDDLITSPFFLQYMNRALDIYSDESKVASIHGYNYPLNVELPETFFLKGADCWGWATWKNKWQHFNPNAQELLNEIKAKSLTKEFDLNNSFPYVKMLEDQVSGAIDSWAIRWLASTFLKDMYTLYPKNTLVINIGMDNTGIHCSKTDVFFSEFSNKPIEVIKRPIERDDKAFFTLVNFFYKEKSFLTKIKRKIKSMFN